MKRYSRHIALKEIGKEGQIKISSAKVLVVGAGGLGCPVLQYLTAAGIGTLGVIDFDEVEESNLQRQVLFGTSSLGKNKALAAKTRLEDLNPTISIHAYAYKLEASNAISLFESYDIIVDGTDNFQARYLINDAALIVNIPVVFGAIYKFEGQLSVFNYNNGPTYRCLFPNPPQSGTLANCSQIGVLGVLPAIIGSMQANEVLKMILGFEEVLSGELYCFDAKTNVSNILTIKRKQKEIDRIKTTPLQEIIDQNCEKDFKEISIEEAIKKENVVFLDVRELDEKPLLEIENYQQIPLMEISKNLHKLNPEKEIIVVCQSGRRSKNAVQILRQNSFNNSYSLTAGASALSIQLKRINNENIKN